MQVSVSKIAPSAEQSSPPFAGYGMEQERTFTFVPVPHVTEQGRASVKAVYIPLTGVAKILEQLKAPWL